MKKVIIYTLFCATILTLCACGRKPTAAEKAQAEAKAAWEALETANALVEKAENDYKQLKDLIGKIYGG